MFEIHTVCTDSREFKKKKNSIHLSSKIQIKYEHRADSFAHIRSRKRKKVGYTNMYLQAVWQLCDRLLQEQRHEQEVELWHVGVFGQQCLQHRESWEVASIPVDLSQSGAPTSTAAHVEA